jgi:hypothetical protein
VAEDREFLRWQLAHANVSVVLINGTSVIDGLLAAGVVSDLAEDRLGYPAKEGTGYLRVFRCASDEVRFLGRNRPLADPLPTRPGIPWPGGSPQPSGPRPMRPPHGRQPAR